VRLSKKDRRGARLRPVSNSARCAPLSSRQVRVVKADNLVSKDNQKTGRNDVFVRLVVGPRAEICKVTRASLPPLFGAVRRVPNRASGPGRCR
jgi:hypothetical protein